MSVQEDLPPPGSWVLSRYRGLVRVPEGPRPQRREIARQVAERHKLTLDRLKSHDRSREVAWPRQEAMWLMYRHGYNKGEIGRTLNRTTWTVDHGIKAHTKRVGVEPN